MTVTHMAGGLRIFQTLVPPVVYLDHWAVRLFADEEALQDRFISGLHRSGGTWLFSTANLMEFVAMTDLAQAQRGEELLQRAMPSVYVADTTAEAGFLFEIGAPNHPDAPDRRWMLTDLAMRAEIRNGELNAHRFLQDAITHRDQLLPLFNDLKAGVSEAVMSLTQDEVQHALALKFRPTPGMTLRGALQAELVRDPHLGAGGFTENDAMDLIHTVPAAVVCDLITLDAAWCHKLERAEKRLRRGGVKGKIASCFSKRNIDQFLGILERY